MDTENTDHRPRAPEDDRRAARCAVVQRRALPLPGHRAAVPGPRSTASTCGSSRARPWRSSGSPARGKTTLLSLVPRLYDVTGGSVTIDGVDMRDLTREELRRHVGMAFEDATLFSPTVRENVLLGRPDVATGAEADALHARGARHRAGRTSSTTCPTASTPGSVKRGCQPVRRPAPAARARPRRSRRGRRCSCSTTRCRRSTSTPRRGSRRASAACSPTTTSLIVAHRPSTVTLADRVALHRERRRHRRRHPLRPARHQRALPLRHLVARRRRRDRTRGGAGMSRADATRRPRPGRHGAVRPAGQRRHEQSAAPVTGSITTRASAARSARTSPRPRASACGAGRCACSARSPPAELAAGAASAIVVVVSHRGHRSPVRR